MVKVNTKVKFTYEDYKSLPNSETKQYEVLGGELFVVPSPTRLHQTILKRIFRVLDDYIMERSLGEVLFAPLDVVLAEDTVLQPDILFVHKNRKEILGKDCIKGAPDLVIEILSKETKKRDRKAKRKLYARHGVQEYWLVNPEEKSIQVLSLGRKDFETEATYKKNEVLKSSLLKEFNIDLREVF